MRLKRGGRRRRARRPAWSVWGRWGVEVLALLTAALTAVIAALGRLADAVAGTGGWWHLLPFAAGVLGVGIVAAALLRGWFGARGWLVRRGTAVPATGAAASAPPVLSLASGTALHAKAA